MIAGKFKLWGTLEGLCRKIHHRLYEEHDPRLAKRFQKQLSKVLDELPQNGSAILYEEGLALLHELRNETSIAIKYRKREIELMERLRDSVHESVEAGEYDAATGKAILVNRGAAALRKRRAILRALEAQEGKSGRSPSANVRRKNNSLVSRGKPRLGKDRSYGRKRPA